MLARTVGAVGGYRSGRAGVGNRTGRATDCRRHTRGEPVRTRNAEKSTIEEIKASAAEPPGSQTFRLQNLEDLPPPFSPEMLAGHKVQAKGVLIRQPNKDRINVISIDSAAPTCSRPPL